MPAKVTPLTPSLVIAIRKGIADYAMAADLALVPYALEEVIAQYVRAHLEPKLASRLPLDYLREVLK